MHTFENSYRASHTAPGYGRRYNGVYNTTGYYKSLWDEIERPLLLEAIAKWVVNPISCLDFACGTGRITGVASEVFERVVGVDISQSMLAENPNAGRAKLINADICQEHLGELFDAALAFRFFLNAEQDLKLAAVRALARHLRPGGMLICNVHMQSTSPMGFIYSVLGRLNATKQRVIRTSEFVRLIEQQGFTVVAVTAYGFLPRPGPLFPHLVARLVGPAELVATRLRVPAYLAQSCLIVARRDDKPASNSTLAE